MNQNMKEHQRQELLAGIEEMRTVSARLLEWAERLERSLEPDEKAPEACPPVSAPVPESPPAPLTLETLRASLAFVCAAGHTEEVRALITACGASTLGQVPSEQWPELKAAAERLVT